MLERIPSQAPGIVACRASGTIMASDLGRFFAGQSGAGALIEIGDLDGYMAEVVGGAEALAISGAFGRVAVVMADDVRPEAELAGLSGDGDPIRLFPQARRDEAINWAGG